MEAQCPHCKAVQGVPEHYRDKTIKCTGCGNPFLVTQYEPAADVAPKPSDARIEPVAPGTGFKVMGVLGVIVALLLNLASEFEDFPLYFLCTLLSLILIALGSILKALSKQND